MRLSEDRIKEAILDADSEIRQRAVRFFATSFSTDTSIMPLVIEAVETFGREDAYHLIGLSRDLPQTEATGRETPKAEFDQGNNDQDRQELLHTSPTRFHVSGFREYTEMKSTE